ncbi:hypothetical protein [Thermomonas sp.]|nr:hypothetical protein [Thermomonas sp.]
MSAKNSFDIPFPMRMALTGSSLRVEQSKDNQAKPQKQWVKV